MLVEHGLCVVRRLAVVAQVQQTLGAVEVGRLDALATQAGVAAVLRRFGHRLRHLANAHETSCCVNKCTAAVRKVATPLYGNSHATSGGSRIFARGVRQLVPLECPKPLYALSPSDP